MGDVGDTGGHVKDATDRCEGGDKIKGLSCRGYSQIR